MAREDASLDRTEPPFFIVGAPRSGTTLLRVMIDRHPEVAIPGEGHFIPDLWAARRRYGRNGRIDDQRRWLRDLAAHPVFRYWELTPEAVAQELPGRQPSFAEAVDAAYRAYARQHGKIRWGDKTPEYVDHLPLLAKLFPDARFVHLLRDGRDVALSTLDLGRLHTHAASAAFFWARHVRHAWAISSSLGAERYLELRYEDLVEEPERRLREVCEFLSLPFQPSMLDHDGGALERLPERMRSIHTRLALPPTKGLRDWRRDMHPLQVAEFEAIAGPCLAEAGYELASATPSLRARAMGRWRIAAFAARYGRRRVWRRATRLAGRVPERSADLVSR